MVGLASSHSQAGHRDKAAELLRSIEAMISDAAPPSDSLKVELKTLREQLSRGSG